MTLFAATALRGVCPLLLAAAWATPAAAQTYTWKRSDNGTWSTPANWVDDLRPPDGGGADAVLVFTNSAALVPVPVTAYTAANDLPGPFDLNALVLDTRFGANAFGGYLGLVVGGTNPLRFVASSTAAAPVITASGAAARVTVPIELGATTTINGGGAGHLFLAGPISGAGGLVHDRTSGFTGVTHELGNQLGFYGGQTIVSGNNTFTGGVTLKGGNLAISIPAAGNTPLGTGTVTVQGTATNPGSLRFDTFSTNPLVNAFQLDGPLYVTGSNPGVVNGAVNGSSDLVVSGVGLRLNAASGLTGRLIADGGPFRSSAGLLTLGNNGTLLNLTSAVLGPAAGGGITLDNTGTNLTNRLADSLVLTSTRTTFTLSGNASANTSEAVGRYVGTGFETIAVSSGAGGNAALTFGGANPIERRNGAVFFLRGAALGTAAPGTTANTQNVLLADGSAVTAALVGNPASSNSTTATDVPVLPWGLGHLAATGNPSRLLTYHAAFGFRPLPDAQFAFAVAEGTASQNNVRLTGAAAAISAPTTVNALVIANTSGAGGVTGPGVLTLTAGTLVSAVSGTGASASVGSVTFPGEGFITVVGTDLFATGTLKASAAGLVKAGAGVLDLSSAPLDVPGPLTALAGQVRFASESSFGNVTEIRLNGGGLRPLAPGGTVTLTKPILVGNAGGTVTTGNAGTSTVTNTVVASVVADMPWTSGTVALPGQARGSIQYGGFGDITPTADNTYSGPTILSASATVVIAREANLGTGSLVVMEGAASLRTTASFTMTKGLMLNGGTGDMTLLADAGTALTWAGPVHQRNSGSTQAAPLTKAGAGTLDLANTDNTFSGLLRINAGTLRLSGTLAPLNSAGLNPNTGSENYGVLVAAGAALTGGGAANRAVFVDAGGTLAPGNGGAGALAVRGADVAAGGTLRVRVTDGATPDAAGTGGSGTGPAFAPTSHALLASPVGTVTIDPLANVVIDGTGTAFTLGAAYSYAVARVGPDGTLTPVTITDPARFTAVGFTATDFSLTTAGGAAFVNFTATPEPGAVLWLAGLGLAGLVRRRRGV